MSEQSRTPLAARRMPASVSAAVAATSDRLVPLEQELLDRYGQIFRMIPLERGESLPLDQIADIDILVVEVDPDMPASLSRIDQARFGDPGKKLIAATPIMDRMTVRALVRRGVNDVVALPFDAEEVFSAVVDLGSTLAEANDDLSPMWGFIHSAGGAGASTLVSHLADHIAQTHPASRCCLIDLDFQFGELAILLGCEGAGSVMDCLEAGDRLDWDILSGMTASVRENLDLLAAPKSIMPPDQIDTDRLLELLTLTRQHYDYVFLDLPTAWNDASLSAACSCSDLLMVVDQSLRSLRRARRTITLLDSVDCPPNTARLIVNCAEKKLFQAIGVKDIAETLSREVVGTIPKVKGGLREMQDRGALLTHEDRRSPFSKAIRELAEYLTGEGEV